MATYEDIRKANAAITPTNIKGKGYAEDNQRVTAFRMVYPTGCITTEIVSLQNGVCVMKSTCIDGEGNVLGVGHAYEKEDSSFINKTSYIENCETSAVGRALGMAGFGIDASICSAEELQNAVLNQDNKGGRRAKNDTAQNEDPLIGAKQAEQIAGLANSKGISVDELCKRAHIKNLNEMRMSTWASATRWLNGVTEGGVA
jgi:hypothetical protein